MLSYITKQKLGNVIQGIGQGEFNLEQCRSSLCCHPYFEIGSIYQRIDRRNQKYLKPNDIQEFFLSNNIEINYQDCLQIVRYCDSNKTGFIEFSEFSDMILPKQDLALHRLASSRMNYYVAPHEFLDLEIELGLIRLFEQIARNVKQYDNLRRQLLLELDYTVNECFNIIDLDRLGYIDFRSIDEFIRLNKYPIPESEILAFIQYADGNHDQKIEYFEFAELVLPGAMPVGGSPVKAAPELVLSPSKRFAASRVVIPNYSGSLYQNSFVSGSPGRHIKQLRVMEKHQEEEIKKIDDNLKYSAYLRQSRQKSIEKSEYNQPRQNSPGGKQQRVLEKHQEDDIAKIVDNEQYSSYLKESRKRSSEKKSSVYSPNQSQVYQSYSQVSENRVTSPLRGNEEQYLMGMLKRVVEIDRDIQNIKIELSLRQDFNLEDCFRLFDINLNQTLTQSEFQAGVNKLGVFPTQDQIFLFFEKFDENKDGLLSFGEFTQVFYTSSKAQISLMKSRPPTYVSPELGESQFNIMTQQTQQILKNLFNSIFETEKTIDNFKLELSQRPLFNVYDAFRALDINNDGQISYEELKEMLRCYGIFPSQNDMQTLIERFDKDKDGTIKYTEFAKEMIPKSPNRY